MRDVKACGLLIHGKSRNNFIFQVIHWRLKERMKTVSVALVACLNIRVDPPDVIKPSPCARMECWTDPYSMTPAKALEQIGKTLEAQYQRWQVIHDICTVHESRLKSLYPKAASEVQAEPGSYCRGCEKVVRLPTAWCKG